MDLQRPKPPPFEIAEWARRPFAERARMLVQAFGLNGNGTPPLTYIFYLFKLGFYLGGWAAFCGLTASPAVFSAAGADFWMSATAFHKAVLWTALYEVTGFGCGSGPLTGRIKPTVAAYMHWLRPGTTKLPLFPGAPLIGGHRRNVVDVLLYAALLLALLRGLVSELPGASEFLPVIILLPMLGVLDRPIFLAARSEHYWTLLVVFTFAEEWVAGSMIVWLALWFFAGVSKLTAHFPSVIGVMTCNSPFTPWAWLRKSMFRDYPQDMRPSDNARRHAIAGGGLELGLPIVMLVALSTQNSAVLVVGVVMIFALHGFILSNVPVGVPLEWNFMMVYGGVFLFYTNAGVTPWQLDSGPVAALLLLVCLVIPLYGNFFPERVSFLLAMRYYAGNWPVSVYFFRGDSHHKLERLKKAAAWIEDQARERLDTLTEEQLRFLVASAMPFRLLHLHGRALHALIPELLDDVEQYTWIDGEVVCGISLGWNFGDGHLHNELLVRALQAQCDFGEGELRCIFLEAQPLLGDSQAYRLYDAKTGPVGSGRFPIEKMRALQPWPDP